MTLTVDVTFSEDIEAADDEVPEPELLRTWATASYLKHPEDAADAIVSVLVSSLQEIQQLNKQYREKDKATNVLSFPMRLPGEVGLQILGDIVLCAAIINEEAGQQSKSAHAHWAHMVIHGMLHLQGYDHIDNKDAEDMETLEIEILKSLGFDNPYQQDS